MTVVITFLTALGLVLFLVGMAVSGGAIVRWVSHRMSHGPQLDLWAPRIAVGLVTFSSLILYLSIFHLLYTPILVMAVSIPILLGAVTLGRTFLRFTLLKHQGDQWFILILIFLLSITALVFLASPPISRDALVYHLEVPRQYLIHHGMVALMPNVYAFFPQGIEMLFLAGLAVTRPFVARCIHFAFLPLTILAVLEYVRHVTGRLPNRWAIAATLAAFVSIPTLWIDATWAYIDTGWMFFTAILVICLDLYYRNRRLDLLVPLLVIAGFYPAIKYTCIYVLFILILILLVMRLRQIPVPGVNRSSITVFLLAALVTTGPYFIRNSIFAGDPLFPFLSSLLPIHNPSWSGIQQQAFRDFLRHYGTGLGTPLLYPLNIVAAAFNLRLNDAAFFDGVIGPFLLVPILVILLWPRALKNRHNAFLFVFVLIYSLVWGMSMRQARFLLPVLPAILLLVFMAMRASLPHTRRWRPGVWISLCLVILGINIWVLLPEWQSIPYGEYIVGQVDKSAFLSDTLPVWPAQHFINTHLPAEASVYVLMTGNENFYLERHYTSQYVVEDYAFHQKLLQTRTPRELAVFFSARHTGYCLLKSEILTNPVLYLDDPPKRILANVFFQNYADLLFEANGFRVYRIHPAVAVRAGATARQVPFDNTLRVGHPDARSGSTGRNSTP